ncbi:MAG: hypothetical protein E6J32_13675 [Chloroflexi bacterium]|nr:MAG: hypothetical protein E6J32_13675 [Chloroflexota bacterium]
MVVTNGAGALMLSAAAVARSREMGGAPWASLGLPTDWRGIVLACGSIGLAMLGIALLLGGRHDRSRLPGGHNCCLPLTPHPRPQLSGVGWSRTGGAGRIPRWQSRVPDPGVGRRRACRRRLPGPGAKPELRRRADRDTGAGSDTFGRPHGIGTRRPLTNPSYRPPGAALRRHRPGAGSSCQAHPGVPLVLPLGARGRSDARHQPRSAGRRGGPRAAYQESAGAPSQTALGRSERRELSLEVRSVLDSLNPGEFLPAFEDYESIVNQARGSAGMHVNAIRRDVVRWRGDLAQTLAKTYVASGDPHSAVRVLEPIVDDDPGREDLAGQLVSAYMAAGQSGRASELRRRFDLKQEV